MSNHDAVRRLTQRTNPLDSMNFADMGQVTRASFSAMDAIQREQSGVQLLSLAVLLLMYCKKYQLNPRDVLYKAGAVVTDAACADNQHIWAIARFLNVHLKDEQQPLIKA